jgi:hypothetical protein
MSGSSLQPGELVPGRASKSKPVDGEENMDAGSMGGTMALQGTLTEAPSGTPRRILRVRDADGEMIAAYDLDNRKPILTLRTSSGYTPLPLCSFSIVLK